MLSNGHGRFGEQPRKRADSKHRSAASARLHVVLCHSRQETLEVKARLADWRAQALAFDEDKMRVVSPATTQSALPITRALAS